MTLPAPEEIRRVAFLGSPSASVPFLLALHEAGYEVPLVVTRPDRRRGRGGAAEPTPVGRVAAELGLTVTDRLDETSSAGADLAVVVAYGGIVPARLLDRLAFVNVHFSLLPRWRGPAPVERAILAGDAETGVCLMGLAPEVDAGPVHRRTSTPIGPDETADELRDRLVALGVELLMGALADGFGPPVPQSGEATHAAKIEPAELCIDWTAPAETVHRVIRAGGAWTTVRGRRLKIGAARRRAAGSGLEPSGTVSGTAVATGDGDGIELVTVQPEGRRALSAADWLNGARLAPGERLGQWD